MMTQTHHIYPVRRTYSTFGQVNLDLDKSDRFCCCCCWFVLFVGMDSEPV